MLIETRAIDIPIYSAMDRFIVPIDKTFHRKRFLNSSFLRHAIGNWNHIDVKHVAVHVKKFMYPIKGIGYRKPHTVVHMIYPKENNRQEAKTVAIYRYPKARRDLMMSTFKK